MLFEDHARKKLNNKISKCRNCVLKNNKGPVLGYGDVKADVMFVGDVPGPVETRTGVPFTGKAKNNVVEMIHNAGLKKGEYYLTYLIKHGITNAKSAATVQYSHCLEHLLAEIELINPRIICSMGIYSTQVLLKHYKIEGNIKGLKAIHGNGLLIPEKIRWNRIIRPMRYLVPAWDPASSNTVINIHMKQDVFTIKGIRDYSELLFDSAKISKQTSLDNCG